jgi:hypothetical protein
LGKLLELGKENGYYQIQRQAQKPEKYQVNKNYGQDSGNLEFLEKIHGRFKKKGNDQSEEKPYQDVLNQIKQIEEENPHPYLKNCLPGNVQDFFVVHFDVRLRK